MMNQDDLNKIAKEHNKNYSILCHVSGLYRLYKGRYYTKDFLEFDNQNDLLIWLKINYKKENN